MKEFIKKLLSCFSLNKDEEGNNEKERLSNMPDSEQPEEFTGYASGFYERALAVKEFMKKQDEQSREELKQTARVADKLLGLEKVRLIQTGVELFEKGLTTNQSKRGHVRR